MRPSTVGFLSVLLGIILLQAASSAETIGQCPYYKMNELVRCDSYDTTACKTDDNCGGLQKCCREICTFKCKYPVYSG
ncbi:WAP four-disulfide core domain protein 12-like [Rana temporaria]|uniref:WAP four-disulfide core domain protein 12-like n=1 Tax=Rana temporaria TaxID=8407 RepID=UPI001AAE0A90|nr:WAP four-disulfide core domain protein 12-like [Rana temporaria]